MRFVTLLAVAVLAASGVAQAGPIDASKKAHDLMFPIRGPERALFEGFEISVPPPGWTAVVNNAYTWEQVGAPDFTAYEGGYLAACFYDEDYTGVQDERICFDHMLQAGDDCLCFFATGSMYWAVDPYQNYNFGVTIDGVDVWNYRDDNDGAVTWAWQEYCIDLSAYTVGETISICLVYEGFDGAQASFDALAIGECTSEPEPCCDSSYIVYELDFNSSNGGATTTACGTGPVPWQWGAPSDIPATACDNVAVTNVWGTNLSDDYPVSVGQGLVVGPFDITPSCTCMELCHFYDIETGFDGGNVKVSTDGGSSWQLAYPFAGYDDVLDSTSYHAQCVWSEEVFTGHMTAFRRDCFDLSAFDGETVYVGFFFGSDSSVTYPGWYLKWLRLGDDASPVETTSWGAVKAMYR